ncbi:MAG: hypothetical protein R3E96_00810 [Planctomycetota bacterium]
MRTLPALIALALVLPAFAKKKEVHLPTKPQGSGFMSAVPFDGEVVGTDVRFDLDKNQVLDLIRGTSPSEGNAVGIPQKFHFGVAERVAELSWVLSKSTSQGDHYEFTLRYPLGQASEREQKKQVI